LSDREIILASTVITKAATKEKNFVGHKKNTLLMDKPVSKDAVPKKVAVPVKKVAETVKVKEVAAPAKKAAVPVEKKAAGKRKRLGTTVREKVVQRQD
jgi:hypothetical protein